MAGESYLPQYPLRGDILSGGSHSEGHRMNSGRFTSIMMEGYHWVRKQLPGPGAQNYAFETMQLAESTPIGPGVRQRQFWATIEPPMFVAEMTRPMSGYGGVVQGQAIYQPLFDPYTNRYGNIMGNGQ